jgi:chorismate mutase/prephenate dehydratase
MSQDLNEIRKTIDSLDDRIHDLLMERAELIVGVTEAKKKDNIPVVQPAREAKMIRRLLARHRGPLPEAAIVHIWRELVGAVSLLQTGLKVAVSTGDGHGFCWDMARNYFGSVLPMTRVSSPVAAIGAVREDEAYFAVLPWPQDGEPAPWWPHLMGQQQKEKIKIVCAMPYGVTKDQNAMLKDRALVVSKTDFGDSGDDRSFIALHTFTPLSRAKLIDGFKKAGLEVLGIVSRPSVRPDEGVHLIEVASFVGETDPRVEKISASIDDANAKAIVVGGYPAPPVYKAQETKNTKLVS